MKKRQNELSQKLYKDINPFSFFSSAVFFNLLSIESFLVPSTKLCTELGGIAILDTKKKTEGKKRRILQMKSGRWDPMNKTNLFQRPLKSF